MITKEEILAARERIRTRVHYTPLLSSARLGNASESGAAAGAGGPYLFLKCESLQRTGSFKVRGALNAMSQLTPDERARGVVTVSAGNHAQALAWAAREVGADCVAVMPEGSSETKIAATREYGGTVELVGGERRRAFERAQQIASEGRVLIHPFEDARVAAGQATVGLEILEQCPDVNTVIVPIGGGGLLAGVAVALKQANSRIRVVGVEPHGAATMRVSLDAGTPQTISPKTLADGLAAPMVGEMTLQAAQRYVDDVVLVSDDEILDAMRKVMSYAKLVVEPAGAAAVAALLHRRMSVERGDNVVAILSGGNVDLDRLKSLL